MEATCLSSSGEKYFKGVIVDKKICQKFLRLEHQDPNWTKGIPEVVLRRSTRRCSLVCIDFSLAKGGMP